MKQMRTTSIFLVALGLSLTACGTKPELKETRPPVVTGVKIEKATLEPVAQSYEATGTVRSKTQTVLSAQVMGNITSLRVREGDHVKAGQALIEIDNRDAAAQLQRAQAALRQAENGVVESDQAISAAQSAKAGAEANKRLASSTLARYQVLLERKSVSPQEFEEVRARHEVAQAEADRAEKMLQMLAAKKKQAQAQVDQATAEVTAARVHSSYARVVSPVTGIVSVRHVEAGAMTTPGTPLLTIEDSSQYRLEASVEESQIGRIKLKDAVSVRIGSISAEDMSGTVAEILPSSDPASRTYTVKVALPVQPLLRSGLYGTARFAAGKRDAILVPASAIVQRGQLTGVFAVDAESIARLRLIKTGKSFGDRVEVLSGLSEGDRIVVAGVDKLADGRRVQ